MGGQRDEREADSARDVVLEVRDLSFAYGAVQVLFDVGLTIDRGEMVALVGTNGAGKSTLMRSICGLAKPKSGTIAFEGVDVTGSSAAAMASSGVVMVPGGRAVFPDLTVAENLQVGSYLLRRDPKRIASRLAFVHGLFPQLSERASVSGGRLSGGEQQQLALAKALLLEPQLLCVDELSLGLAPNVVERLLEAVREVNRQGTTVLLVEQSLNIAASLCERALFMEKGQFRFEGATRDLLDNDDIARAVFLGALPA